MAVIAVAGCGSSTQTATITTLSAAKPTADQLQQQFVGVVNSVSPEVVQIQTNAGLGSGVVFNGDGDIVTNAHVVTGAKTISVTLTSGARHSASIVGIYPQSDIAVIHIGGARPHPATFADSSKIEVGEIVLAIGNPLGLRSSVTQGIVSSAGRTVSEGNGVVLPSVIQTSAAINPGNSGGALVNLEGAVVGIPTLAAIDPEFGEAPAPGIGFAIPSNTAKEYASELVATGKVAQAGRAYLGVVVATIVVGGVVVESVIAGGPAAKAGIEAGEQIASVAGQSTPSTEAISSVLATLRPGQTVPVQVLSPTGRESTVQVKLGSQPGS
ncbi:MAG TPA: trypsin-like peptidase domain-containing protein [Solirubrobacteraceae bacterium]|jgi:putative serine protease PepD|nr:trypsin-like peptidase domain-containing protein [Solirubrobacteraceae bacterium]